MDFFTVPTVTFGVLYCFFINSHNRRRILHFNVTRHPTSLWIVQQLREAFPFELALRFLIFDRGSRSACCLQQPLDGHPRILKTVKPVPGYASGVQSKRRIPKKLQLSLVPQS